MRQLPSFLLRCNISKRIGKSTTHTHHKVQVITGRISGTAHIANYLTSSNHCAGRNGCGRHVGVARGEPRAIVDQNLVAKAVVPAADQNRTGVGGQNRGPFRGRNVNAPVTGIAESIRFSELGRHAGMPWQRPDHGAISHGWHCGSCASSCAAQLYQHGPHLIGKKLMQNIHLIICKSQVMG